MNLSEIARTTSFRLAMVFACFFAGSSLLLFAFIYWRATVFETNRIDALITEDARTLASEDQDAILALINTHVTGDFHRVGYAALFTPDGRRIDGNLETVPADLPVDGKVHVVRAARTDLPAMGAIEVRLAALRIPNGNILIIGRNGQYMVVLREVVMHALTMGAIPAMGLALAAGIFLAWRTQQRLKDVHRAAERIMSGQVQERLPVAGAGPGDELDRLSQLFNGILDETERLLGEIKATGDEIAHDLRTPLTRVRARLERTMKGDMGLEETRETVGKAIGGLDQALAVITALLRIRELENSKRQRGFTMLDPAEIILLIEELYEPIAETKDITFTVDVTPVAPMFADRDLLMEAVGNLVDNALKFTPTGGRVTLSLGARDSDGAITIRVADSGPGIAAHERDLVFSRFYRSDRTRHLEGTGLGLSLVAAIARLHGLSPRVGDNNPGCVMELVAEGATAVRAPVAGATAV
ncbi:HAMP domain-containing sensor histidine kinase [Nitrospirillum sp. BR 11828]|uniref:sensor histidine kinase n=1 Tax=Nitrospirillum sp. BR 11828 TaxID=3104325 RepID=UPI002ACAE7EF|nr:HAMP domain-containing sensor histidine kinase [Nitrospirillum sp. BR 11828]MDZ5645969.1 HAMP domain-containing sensor histidine kinase [Nitrospirillum sp. BR 11828]